MLEGYNSRQVYALDLPDGSRLRLNLTKTSGERRSAASASEQAAGASGSPSNILTELPLRPGQSITVQASRQMVAASSDGGNSTTQNATSLPSSSSYRMQDQLDVHDLTILEDTPRATSAAAATGGRHRRGLAQVYAGSYAAPTMPYSPTIIFALMSNCGGPLPTSMAAMSAAIFGDPSAPQNQSFWGWNKACSYGQVTIVPGSVVVKEVRLGSWGKIGHGQVL